MLPGQRVPFEDVGDLHEGERPSPALSVFAEEVPAVSVSATPAAVVFPFLSSQLHAAPTFYDAVLLFPVTKEFF